MKFLALWAMAFVVFLLLAFCGVSILYLAACFLAWEWHAFPWPSDGMQIRGIVLGIGAFSLMMTAIFREVEEDL